jgi:hypothetical protein
MSDTRPALEYLVACSDMSLESFRISRMNQAANLRKQVHALVDEWIEAEVDAGLSRWMLEGRRANTVSPALRVDCPPQDKSLEHVAISFRSGHVEVSAAATRQRRLPTGLAEAEDAGACPFLEDGTTVPDDGKTEPQNHAKKMRKPYAKPLARRHLASSSEGAGAVVMPRRSRPKAQHELEFEFGAPLVSVVEIEEATEPTVSRAAAEDSSLPSEKPPRQETCGLAEAATGHTTRCLLQERRMRPRKPYSCAFSIRPCPQSESNYPALRQRCAPLVGSDCSVRIVVSVPRFC